VSISCDVFEAIVTYFQQALQIKLGVTNVVIINSLCPATDIELFNLSMNEIVDVAAL